MRFLRGIGRCPRLVALYYAGWFSQLNRYLELDDFCGGILGDIVGIYRLQSKSLEHFWGIRERGECLTSKTSNSSVLSSAHRWRSSVSMS